MNRESCKSMWTTDHWVILAQAIAVHSQMSQKLHRNVGVPMTILQMSWYVVGLECVAYEKVKGHYILCPVTCMMYSC